MKEAIFTLIAWISFALMLPGWATTAESNISVDPSRTTTLAPKQNLVGRQNEVQKRRKTPFFVPNHTDFIVFLFQLDSTPELHKPRLINHSKFTECRHTVTIRLSIKFAFQKYYP